MNILLQYLLQRIFQVSRPLTQLVAKDIEVDYAVVMNKLADTDKVLGQMISLL